jgi:hypothetical protein
VKGSCSLSLRSKALRSGVITGSSCNSRRTGARGCENRSSNLGPQGMRSASSGCGRARGGDVFILLVEALVYAVLGHWGVEARA